jgi:flagellar biosynthesis chaperone FliJ
MSEDNLRDAGEQILDALDAAKEARSQRLEAERRTQEAARLHALQAEVCATDTSLRVLIAKHASLRQQFAAELCALAQSSAKLAACERKIDQLRQVLYQTQRDLKGDALDLPALDYAAVEILPTIISRLRR